MQSDPVFTTKAEVQTWIMQRMRYPDPAPGALQRALADVKRVTDAHAHLTKDSDNA